MSSPQTTPSACEACPVHRSDALKRLGIDIQGADFVVALAGNPNTGKSTIFNALTGLRQHTGNWPGKTVTRAEGGFESGDHRYRLVDLPGTYSLLSTSHDEEVARNFLLFSRPDVTVIVVDATRLERNLNLVLQILEITDRVVICLNLMDEARRNGISIDERNLSRRLGVPVVPASARFRRGIPELLDAIEKVATGEVACRPHRVRPSYKSLTRSTEEVGDLLGGLYPSLPNRRWLALRLLDGDQQIIDALRNGELARLGTDDEEKVVLPPIDRLEQLLTRVEDIRFQLGSDFQDQLIESIYSDAAEIKASVVEEPGVEAKPDIWKRIDQVVTSRTWGFPIMFLLLAGVFFYRKASRDEVMELGVRVGDPMVLDTRVVHLANERVVSRAIDNRIGAYVVLEAVRLLAEDPGDGPAAAFAVATAQEEIGYQGGGARSSAYALEPDVALVVDVTFSTDVPDVPKKELGDHQIGGGPVLSRGSAAHPVVFDRLVEAAEAEEIEHTLQAAPRATRTDADGIHLVRSGIPTGLVSVPNRYMHSPNELVSLKDLERTARLLAAFIRRLEADADFTPR